MMNLFLIQNQVINLPPHEICQAYLNNIMFQICLKEELADKSETEKLKIIERSINCPNTFADCQTWHELKGLLSLGVEDPTKPWDINYSKTIEDDKELSRMVRQILLNCFKNNYSVEESENRFYLDVYKEVFIDLN